MRGAGWRLFGGRHLSRAVAAAAVLFALGAVACSQGLEGEAGTSEVISQQGTSPELQAALDKGPHLFEFQRTPLADVATVLQTVAGVSIVLSLQDVPADGALVTLAGGGTLEEWLDRICAQTGLAWKAQGTVILIGSRERLESVTIPRVGVVPPDMDKKLTIQVSVDFERTSLPEVGRVLGVRIGCPVVVHRGDLDMLESPVTRLFSGEARELLDAVCLQTDMKWRADAGIVKIASAQTLRTQVLRPPVPAGMKEVLRRKGRFDFYETPLTDACQLLQEKAGAKIGVRRADAASASLCLVTLHVDGTLEEALDSMAWESGFVWAVRGDAVEFYVEKELVWSDAEWLGKLLKAQPEIIGFTDIVGQTPLHHACIIGDVEAAKLLLAAGADVEATNRDGLTPLDIARLAGNEDFIALLSQHAARQQ